MKVPALTLLLSASILLGCATGTSQLESPLPPGERPLEDEGLLPPPGFGTLRQDEISLQIQSGDLLIKVTPLDEGILRLTAPDTYTRLRGLAEVHGPRAARTSQASQSCLFLVSLFSYSPDVTYEPEDLLLVNRGLRLRPQGIAPVTPTWGTQRLGQQETRMAIYAFEGGIEWEADLIVEYQQLRNETWMDQVFPLLQAEKTKVRARAGGG